MAGVVRWLEQPLPFRWVEDVGMRDYREFVCSQATFDWLRSGAMTHVDGEPVWLQVMDRVGGNVFVKAWPADGRTFGAGTYAWQEERVAA